MHRSADGTCSCILCTIHFIHDLVNTVHHPGSEHLEERISRDAFSQVVLFLNRLRGPRSIKWVRRIPGPSFNLER